ncbi:M28 family peptidase [Thermicanus aegyptius]|uniref:M28 family peptidase n=1 Tax=Thermicanus aegyptius TaxID=94009 RepID=UPI00040343D3|nr:M28 family peptidase [Thermicanus aegyptius]
MTFRFLNPKGKRKRFYLLVVGFFLLSSFISSCDFGQTETIKRVVDELSSDTYQGRLVGTPGNEKAQEWIISRMKTTQFLPLNGNYLHEYTQFVPNLNAKPELWFSGIKSEISLQPLYFTNQEEFTGTLSSEIQHPSSPIILLAENPLSIDWSNDRIIAVIEKSNLSRREAFDVSIHEKPRFQVSEEDYQSLLSHQGSEVQIQWNHSVRQERTANLVMHNPFDGKKIKRIFVLGAHFDHIGKRGNLTYPGAVDNASGIAALLDVSQKIDPAKIPDDAALFIVGFNGEETGLDGSRAFAAWLKEKYHLPVFAIVFDILGIKGESKLSLTGSESFKSIISNSLEKKGFKINQELDVSSDHDSFIQLGEEGVLLTDWNEEYMNQYYQTPSDRPDLIDSTRLQSISTAMAATLEELFQQDHIASPQMVKPSQASEPGLPEEDVVKTAIDLLKEKDRWKYPLISHPEYKVKDIRGYTDEKGELNRIEYSFLLAALQKKDADSSLAKEISVTVFPVPEEIEPEQFLQMVKGENLKEKGAVELFKKKTPYYTLEAEGYTFYRIYALIHFDGKNDLCEIDTPLTKVGDQVTVVGEEDFLKFVAGLDMTE